MTSHEHHRLTTYTELHGKFRVERTDGANPPVCISWLTAEGQEVIKSALTEDEARILANALLASANHCLCHTHPRLIAREERPSDPEPTEPEPRKPDTAIYGILFGHRVRLEWPDGPPPALDRRKVTEKLSEIESG